MATHIWQGDMAAVAQIDTVQITAYDAATTYILTVGGKTVSVVGDTDVNTTATNLAAAWNASTQAEFAEVTATVATDTVTLTADTAGKPFTASSSVSGGAGTIGAVTSSTANAGPNLWIAGNFDTGTLPANTDTVIFENSAIDCLYLLDQNTVTLTLLVIKASYTGKIGLPRTNSSGYVEYRDTALKISATTIKIGEGVGSGSSRLKLNVGSVQTALNIYSSPSTRAETGIPCVLFTGTHASNTITVEDGDLGAAFFGGETATVATLNVASGKIVCGSGTTGPTTANIDGGTVSLESNITTVNQTAGTVHLKGSATVGTWNLDGGTCYYRSSGTLTTVNVRSGGVLDFREDQQARTVINCNAYEGYVIHDPTKTVTWTNGIDLVRCSLTSNLNVGSNMTVSLSAI
jgi:hypothetical protein